MQWLENKGQLRFEFHDIGRYYGAATALAGDIEGASSMTRLYISIVVVI